MPCASPCPLRNRLSHRRRRIGRPPPTDANAPPMGMRMRLKASFDISGFSSANQVILTALKKYGMILADNGSAIFITGMPDSHWNNNDLDMLKSITASSFDVVLMNPVYTPSNVPPGPSPGVPSFTAVPMTARAGQPVTLSWNVTGAIYNIVSPQVGPVRGTSVVVTPAATTTYGLFSTNQHGRKTAKGTVPVQWDRPPGCPASVAVTSREF